MKRESGVALITVLLVVALAVVVCAGLITRQQLAVRSAANQLHVNQLWHYALGGEVLAKALLRRDWQSDQGRAPLDHAAETWAQLLAGYALDEGGQLQLQVVDASGRFNLNSLVRGGQPDNLALQRFRRLLLHLHISEPYAERLQDWLDSDEGLSSPQGAEDNDYLLLSPPYRAGNRALVDVSELRLLLGMSEADYQRLRPHVVALPAEVPVNVNSAGALVLASLLDGVEVNTARAWVLARRTQPFTSVEAFLAQTGAANAEAARGLAVASEYFEANTEVRLGERVLRLKSLLQRTAQGEVRVLARDLGQDARGLNVEEGTP